MSKDTTFTKAALGDRVYSIEFGYGTIVDFKKNTLYQLCVKFNDPPVGSERTEEYTRCGRQYIDDLTQTLFWDKPEIIAPSRPKRIVKKEVSRFLVIDKDTNTSIGNHPTLEDAQGHSRHAEKVGVKVIIVELKGSYEIEQ